MQRVSRLPVVFAACFLTLWSLTHTADAATLDFQTPGVPDDLAGDLRAASTLAASTDEGDPTGQDILAAAYADYRRLIAVLYDAGYFAPVINIRLDGREAASIPAVSPPARVDRIRVDIAPGPPFRFGTARIAPLAPGTELPEAYRSGAPASTGAISGAAEAGVEGWRQTGHAKAEVSGQRITANHNAQRVDADLTLAPGPRLTFGRLSVKGNKAVRTNRILKISGLPTGRVFDPDEVNKAAARLRRTGAFNSVSLTEAATPNADGSLGILAEVAEAKPRRFGFGAEVSTQEGLGLSGFWLHRNLFGGAERLRIEAEIEGIGGSTGGTDGLLSARFSRPATFNEDTDFYIEAELEREREPFYDSDSASIEAGIIRYASDEREYSLGLGFERASITDAFGSRNYTILKLPATATFDYRDNPLNATDGYYVNAQLTPFVSLSGSETGARTFVDARAYRSFGADDRVTLALRGQLGSVVGASLENAPSDFLFYSGGSSTVRGHSYQSLNVDLGGGRVVGGRSFAGLSTEVRVKTGENISLVGFYDLGYVGPETFPDGSTGGWHSGAGLGIRYNTGIGPLRVDIAVPVSGPGNPSGVQLYIGIGQAF